MLTLPTIDRRGWLALWAQRRSRHRRQTAVPADPPGPSSTLLPGLVAYWPMDEEDGVRFDATANGNDLVPLGGVDTYASGTGLIGRCLTSPDGLDDSSWLELSPTPGLVLGNSFTFSCWVRLSTNPNIRDDWSGVINWGNADWDEACWLAFFYNIDPDMGDLGWSYKFGINNLYSATNPGGAPPVAGEWNFMVLTYTAGDGLGRFYLNGALVYVTEDCTPTMSPPTFLNIGGCGLRNGDYNNYHFAGELDEFGIWNRALSGDEVSQLYNQGDGLAYECF